MSNIRERNQDDKIKNRGKRKNNKSAPQTARRVMTAKLKRELAQRKRGGVVSDTPRDIDSTADSTTEATEQVEHTTEAAVREVGQQARHSVSRAVTKAKKELRKGRERRERPQKYSYPPETSAPIQPKATASQAPASLQIKVDVPETPSPVHPKPLAPEPPVKTLSKKPVPEIPVSVPPVVPVSDTLLPDTPFPNTPLPVRMEPHIPETIRMTAAPVQPMPQVPSLAKDTFAIPVSPVAPKEKPMDISIKPVQPKTRLVGIPDRQAVPKEHRVRIATKQNSTFRGRKVPGPKHVPESQPLPQLHREDIPPDQPIQQVWIEDAPVDSTAPSPTPGERMRQRAMNDQRELTQYPAKTFDLPNAGEQFPATHYGKSTATLGSSTVPRENRSSGNQSIHQSIKERPRCAFVLKEKPKGGTIPPKTRQQAEKAVTTTVTPAKPLHTPQKSTTVKQVIGQARRKAQAEAQRSMLQGAKKTAQKAADLSKKTTVAAAKAVRALINALSALVGGSALIAALCVIFLVATVIASPFGILFSNEPSPGAVPLNAAISQINMELTDKLTLLQAGDYDSIDIRGAGPDWREVAAVFACKTSMGADGVDVAALTPDRVARLKAVFWDMCAITFSVETIDHPATEDAEAWTEKILHITITPKTADDMRTVYSFNSDQNSALTELLNEPGILDNLLGSLGISQEDAVEILQQLPEDLLPERRAVVETACKLVGKVNYFWGGKSHVIGWDSRWGTLQKVTAAGSPSTGTYRPFGLDCSGMIDWVLRNCGLPSDGNWYVGTNLTQVTQANALPGDFALYPDASHIGIIVGRNDAGKLLVCHCSSGKNNVVITEFIASGFTVVGRPAIF